MKRTNTRYKQLQIQIPLQKLTQKNITNTNTNTDIQGGRRHTQSMRRANAN